MLVWILSYDREKYFRLKTFLPLNISYFNFFCVKIATLPPWKRSPPLSQQPPSKSCPVKPRPLFENLVGGSNPPPSRKGEGGCTLWVICGISVAYFQWHLFYFQDILNLKDRYVSVYSITYYEVSIKIINEDLS